MHQRPTITVLTQTNEQGASARLRMYAFKADLEARGYTFDIRPGVPGAGSLHYLKLFWQRWRELPKVARSSAAVVIQRDLINHLQPWLERRYAAHGVPLIFDVDDAIDLRPPGFPPTWRTHLFGCDDKLEQLSRLAHTMVVGNEHLASRVREWCPRVEVIPTVLDLRGFDKAKVRQRPRQRAVVIGWIGSPLTTPYLELVRPALARLAKDFPLTLRTVGAARLDWPEISLDQREWTKDSADELVRSFDIGIMPLSDDEWSRSKCGTKILQYFVEAIPVVASPVGMNRDALDNGRAGLMAESSEQWYQGLRTLINNDDVYQGLSAAGRKRVEERYNVELYSEQWHRILQSVLGQESSQ